MINEIKNIEIEMKKILNIIVILFFGLTFAACGAAAFTGGFQGYLGIVGIALLFGTVFIAMFYSIGNI